MDEYLGQAYDTQFLPLFDKFLEAAFGDVSYFFITYNY